VALSGQNPLAYLYTRDSFKRNIMFKIAARHAELLAELREDLARRIINTLSNQMKG
jgi:hypothetical protein